MTKIYKENNLSESYSRHLIRGSVRGNLGINSAVRYSAIYGEGIDRLEVLRRINKENKFRFWWYIIFSVLAVACLCIWHDSLSSWLSVLETFVLMINIDLVSRGKVAGIYVGIADCILYIIISAFTGLWGEVIKMCVINIPLNIVAIISWSKNLKKQKTASKYAEQKSIDVKRLTYKGWLVNAAVFAVTAVVGYFFLGWLGTTSLIISAISLAIGVLSKVLSGWRYMESYIVSIVGNLISLALWASVLIEIITSGAAVSEQPVQILNVFVALSSNIYSYFLWRGMYRKRVVNGGTLLNMRPVKIKKVVKLRRIYRELYWDKSKDTPLKRK